MTLGVRSNWLVWVVVAGLLALVAYAWIDGGRESVRTISVPVAVPEPPR